MILENSLIRNWSVRCQLLFSFFLCPETSSLRFELTRVGDPDRCFRGTRVTAETLNALHNILTLKDLSKHNVFSIKPRSLHGGDEKLGSIRVGACVRHGKVHRGFVLELEVLVGKLFTVNALASSAVAIGKVSSLEHEVGDDSVEDRSFVVKGFSLGSHSLLSSAERTEVFNRLRDGVTEQTHNDTSALSTIDLNVKENLARYRRGTAATRKRRDEKCKQ